MSAAFGRKKRRAARAREACLKDEIDLIKRDYYKLTQKTTQLTRSVEKAFGRYSIVLPPKLMAVTHLRDAYTVEFLRHQGTFKQQMESKAFEVAEIMTTTLNALKVDCEKVNNEVHFIAALGEHNARYCVPQEVLRNAPTEVVEILVRSISEYLTGELVSAALAKHD